MKGCDWFFDNDEMVMLTISAADDAFLISSVSQKSRASARLQRIEARSMRSLDSGCQRSLSRARIAQGMSKLRGWIDIFLLRCLRQPHEPDVPSRVFVLRPVREVKQGLGNGGLGRSSPSSRWGLVLRALQSRASMHDSLSRSCLSFLLVFLSCAWCFAFSLLERRGLSSQVSVSPRLSPPSCRNNTFRALVAAFPS